MQISDLLLQGGEPEDQTLAVMEGKHARVIKNTNVTDT